MFYYGKHYKEISGFPGYYINKETQKVISTIDGRNCKLGEIKELKATKGSNGYMQLCLKDKNGDKKSPSLHRLMMTTFSCTKIKNAVVNHIDGNKTNNCISNLEWCTAKQNTEHAHRTGLVPVSSSRVPVHMYGLDGVYVRSFVSVREAAQFVGGDPANVVYCAKKVHKTCKGFIFSYKKCCKVSAYGGNPIIEKIQVNNTETGEEAQFSTIKRASDYTKIHRSKFMRRFDKSDTFYLEKFRIKKFTK